MKKKKVVLAYSGGLDTSVILKWLQSEKNLDVIAFVADVGQKDELELAKKNAIKMGAIKVLVVDLKNIFAKNFIFPMFRAKINLIPFNPWPGSKYQVSSKEKIENFKNYILEKGKLVATIRTPRGEDVLAACGQLKSLG